MDIFLEQNLDKNNTSNPRDYRYSNLNDTTKLQIYKDLKYLYDKTFNSDVDYNSLAKNNKWVYENFENIKTIIDELEKDTNRTKKHTALKKYILALLHYYENNDNFNDFNIDKTKQVYEQLQERISKNSDTVVLLNSEKKKTVKDVTQYSYNDLLQVAKHFIKKDYKMYTILNIWINLPFRNLFLTSIYTTKKDYNKMDNEFKKNNNFIILGKAPLFIRHDYKNDKTKKNADKPIYTDLNNHKDLLKILKKYVKLYDIELNQYFFPAYKNKTNYVSYRVIREKLIDNGFEGITETSIFKIVLLHNVYTVLKTKKDRVDYLGYASSQRPTDIKTIVDAYLISPNLLK